MNFYLILFADNTEQAFLNNYEDIVDSSLPVQKVMNLFPDKEAAEDSFLAKISYCEERTEVCLTSFYCDMYLYNIVNEGHFLCSHVYYIITTIRKY